MDFMYLKAKKAILKYNSEEDVSELGIVAMCVCCKSEKIIKTEDKRCFTTKLMRQS